MHISNERGGGGGGSGRIPTRKTTCNKQQKEKKLQPVTRRGSDRSSLPWSFDSKLKTHLCWCIGYIEGFSFFFFFLHHKSEQSRTEGNRKCFWHSRSPAANVINIFLIYYWWLSFPAASQSATNQSDYFNDVAAAGRSHARRRFHVRQEIRAFGPVRPGRQRWIGKRPFEGKKNQFKWWAAIWARFGFNLFRIVLFVTDKSTADSFPGFLGRKPSVFSF